MAKSKEERWSDVHQRAMSEFDLIQAAQREERLQCLQDRRFYSIAGAQWEGDLGAQFANKPKLEINKIHLAVIRIISEYRNQRVAITFGPKDGQPDEFADTCAGLVRADEEDSSAEEAYDNAFEEAVGGGFGAFRLRAKYEDEDDDENDKQRVCFEPIPDADSSVFFSLDAKRQDKADAKRCFVLTAMSRDAYTEKYDDDPTTWPKSIQQIQFDWCTPDVVYICEMYAVEEKTELIHYFRGLDDEDMAVPDEELKEDEDKLPTLLATGFREVRQKRVKRKKVTKYTMNGNPVYVGFQTPSRYLFIPSQSGRQAQIRVDGKLLPAGSPVTWPSNNNMAKIDFGSVGAGAGRKIVVQGIGIPNLWLSEVSVTAGSAIVPYDYLADTGKITAAFLGDSYQLGGDYSLVGLPFVQYMAELCGFGATIQSSIGGTGYITNGGSADYPDMQSAIRQAIVTRDSPTVVVVQAGINDPGGGATNTGMSAVYTALRAALPNALIVAQTAWAPSQTAGQAGGGKYQLMRTNLYSVMAGLAGPWILIDNLAGTWSTSKGTNSGAGTGPWQTGDGRVGAPTGTGNGDTWVSADGTHPTAAGYKGLGELFAAAYKAAVASM